MSYVVEMVYRGSETERARLEEAHRSYWRRMGDRGVLLGGGPWHDGSGQLPLCDADDRPSAPAHRPPGRNPLDSLDRVIVHADHVPRSRVVVEGDASTLRQWV